MEEPAQLCIVLGWHVAALLLLLLLIHLPRSVTHRNASRERPKGWQEGGEVDRRCAVWAMRGSSSVSQGGIACALQERDRDGFKNASRESAQCWQGLQINRRCALWAMRGVVPPEGALPVRFRSGIRPPLEPNKVQDRRPLSSDPQRLFRHGRILSLSACEPYLKTQ